MKTVIRSISRAMALTLVASLAPLLTSSANAQFGGEAGFRKAFQPDYLARDAELLNEILALEEWQKPIVEVLLDDYQTDYRAGEASFRNRLMDISGQLAAGGQDDAMRQLLVPFQEWELEKSKIAKRFEDDVRIQLSDDQTARWPALERALRREKILPDSVLSGEGVDLILVSKQIDLPLDLRRGAEEAFLAYELQLDDGLTARDLKAGEAQADLREALIGGDTARGLSGLGKILDSRVALRIVQDRHIEELTAALGAEWGATFRQAALRAAYPKAYRARTFMTVFEQVLAIDSLTEEQLSAVLETRDQYVLAMDTLEAKLRTILQREEPERELATANAATARARGESPATKPADTFRIEAARRETIQDEAATRLRDILTPEQLEQVPVLLKRSSPGKADERSSGKVNNRFGDAGDQSHSNTNFGDTGRPTRPGGAPGGPARPPRGGAPMDAPPTIE
ncbi:MAG: hypothetical protein O2819_05675 [Planctomycetota bacterium]|nr:hypothetical protein [Planctomycetota bacterium]